MITFEKVGTPGATSGLGAGIVGGQMWARNTTPGRETPWRRMEDRSGRILRYYQKPVWSRPTAMPQGARPSRSTLQRRTSSVSASTRARRAAAERRKQRTAAWQRSAAVARRQQAKVAAQKKALAARIAQYNAAAAAARKQKMAERQANLDARPKTPKRDAGIRVWEAYYAQIGRTLAPEQRARLERKERKDFFRKTARTFYVPRNFGKISRVGVKAGVSWMFAVAYGGQDMPYWNQWFDGKSSAHEIAAKVAADYMAAVTRRSQLQQREREAYFHWVDAGKVGARPVIDENYVLDKDAPTLTQRDIVHTRPLFPALPQAPILAPPPPPGPPPPGPPPIFPGKGQTVPPPGFQPSHVNPPGLELPPL